MGPPQRFIIYIPETRNNNIHPKRQWELDEIEELAPYISTQYWVQNLIQGTGEESGKVLPKLVHSDQTGFVNGRYIGQNIRFLNDVQEWNIQILRKCMKFIFVDFEKAFDTIEWSFTSKTLEVFKFGCYLKRFCTFKIKNN